ncbi:MAG: TonB-dependent receptor [Acidobacteria bacterium]|nr:TonB-dependent receptor [Acidobacteriota bacterium]
MNTYTAFSRVNAKRILLLSALAVALPGLIWGQVITGTLVGTVRDSSGAVVVAAKVTVLNQNTGISLEAASNDQGEYVVPYLPPGTYRLSVEFSGFRNAVSLGNILEANQTLRVDFKLQPGEISERIEVNANVAQLQTETTSVQSALDERVIKAVPNITHNPFYFATLQPGVVGRNQMNDTTSSASFGIGTAGRGAFSAISINGGQTFTNGIYLDGVSVQGTVVNETAVIPNPDGIQEVRTITNNLSAEYGRGMGAISIITKGGTNEFHGSVFDRVRNEALNANTFANNALKASRPPFKVNSFGATGGGPIVKDKAFFFVSYEGLRHTVGLNGFATVPTAAEKLGDFSKTLVNVNGVPTPIRLFDPFNVRQIGPNLYERAEIPNADVRNGPRGADPFALKLLSFYPASNRTPDDVYNNNNYFRRVIQTFSRNNINSRVDYRLSRKHSLYSAFGIQKGSITTPSIWGDDSPFFNIDRLGWAAAAAPIVSDKNPYASIGDTIVFSPTLLVDIRYGITRANSRSDSNIFPDFNYDQFGVPKEIQSLIPRPGAATDTANVSRWSALGVQHYQHKHGRTTNHNAVGSLSKTLSKWTLKAGAEYRVYLSNYQDLQQGALRLDAPGWCGTCGGSYTSQFITATGAGVQNPTAATSGFDEAAALLGAGSWALGGDFTVTPAFAQKYFGIYTQNDWRATPRLTLNLGLRWDLQPGPTERFDRMTSFDRDATNPFNSPGAWAFPGKEGYSRNLWDTHYKDFGPRLGAAYRLGDTWVVRGAYGITYLPTNTGYYDGPYTYGTSPFVVDTNQLPYGTSPNGVPIGTFHDAVVTGRKPAIGFNPSAPQLYGTIPYVFDRHNFLNGRMQQWNVFIEKSLGSTWLVSAGYSASKGNNLPIGRFPFQALGALPAATLECYRNGANCSGANSDVAGKGYVQTGEDPANSLVPNPFNPGGTLPFQGALGQAVIPRQMRDSRYPLFFSNPLQVTPGFSDYHSMILQVNRRFAAGLQFNAHYTWSKSLDFTATEAHSNGHNDVSGSEYNFVRDVVNLRNNRKLSTTDVPHRLVYSVVYELPFGAGKRFAVENRVLRHIASGWRLGSVGVFQSGLPLVVGGGANGSLNITPDVVPGAPRELPEQLQGWYDGKTTITLPSGRNITPNANSFLKYNPDAFRGRVISNPGAPGSFIEDRYWYGTAGLTYGGLRNPRRNNVNLSIARSFQATERFVVEFAADVFNFFNHTQFRSYDNFLGGVVTQADPATKTPLGAVSGASSYGTHGLATFDPRQVEINLRVRF